MADVLDIARRVVHIETAAVAALAERLDHRFVAAVDLMYACKGRVIVTGIGKSGIIGKKIASTLSSTGTPSLFLHAGEGLHGDLGVVMKDDVVVCISKSGNGGELKMLLPLFRKLGVPIIAMTGKLDSDLATHADVVLDISVAEEACPHDLAPTSSSTATLVMGDALAIALLDRRNFSPEDFAFRHPGGTLGRRLLLRIDDVMGAEDRVPKVLATADLQKVILEITAKLYGATCVVSETDVLLGIVTDGDLRRLLTGTEVIQNLTAKDIMSAKPKTISVGTLALAALEILEDHDILQVIVVDGQNKPVGMVHLHDLLKAGVA